MNIYVRNAIVSATGAVILGTGIGCAVQPVARPILQTLTTTTATATTTTVPAIPCIENWGPGQVQVKWENELGCDLVPPQELIVIIDERSWAEHTGSSEGWGGDASLAWADQEIADMGGVPVWHDGAWVEGNVDY